MGAGHQSVEATITGTGSGRPAVPATMRAVVLDAPGPPSALAIRELPVLVPSAGQVLIRSGRSGSTASNCTFGWACQRG
jgi:hypothetical protein